MIQAISSCKLRTAAKYTVLVMSLFCVIGFQVGFTEEDDMHRENLRISIDAKRVTFATPSILKEGKWFVPLEHFAKQLGLKIEYPDGAEMAVLCGGVASELCVPLQFRDSENGVIDVEGVSYVQPTLVTKPFGFETYQVSVNQIEVVQPSRLASQFTLSDLENVPRSLQDFRGKKTLLYIWGSW